MARRWHPSPYPPSSRPTSRRRSPPSRSFRWERPHTHRRRFSGKRSLMDSDKMLNTVSSAIRGHQVATFPIPWTWRLLNGSRLWLKQVDRASTKDYFCLFLFFFVRFCFSPLLFPPSLFLSFISSSDLLLLNQYSASFPSAVCSKPMKRGAFAS